MAKDTLTMRSCFEQFPFVDGFEQVLSGEVSYEYLSQLACVLRTVIDIASEAVDDGEVHEATVVSLIYCSTALARVTVAQAYAAEAAEYTAYIEGAVLAAMNDEWAAMVDRDGMVFVNYSESIGSLLSDMIATLWYGQAFTQMLSAGKVLKLYRPAVVGLRVMAVGDLLVEAPRGRLLVDVPAGELHKSLISLREYRYVVKVVKERIDGDITPDDVSKVVDQLVDMPQAVGCGQLVDWLWLVASSLGRNHGYCYQLLMPPVARFAASQVLGGNPTVAELLWYLHKLEEKWADREAVVTLGETLHVEQSGSPPVPLLGQYSDRRIGMLPSPVGSEPDYFARALVDQFIKRHKRVHTEETIPFPVDSAFEALSLDTTVPSGSRGFVDVAAELYSGVGEVVSPRTEVAERLMGGAASTDDHLNERDSERVREIYARLADGAVIEERYFRRSRHRFIRKRHRPHLDVTEGHAYHVFAGFPAEGGGGTGPWQLDPYWDIPGWRSYIATFDPGVSTLSFIAPDSCMDVRMDCSGDGALEFGDCKVATVGTVLWFTQSIKFRLVAKEIVDLRVSVPDAGSAQAIGIDMRRYLYIPGYAIAVRSFEVVTGNPTISIPVQRARGSLIAGCHFYTGLRFVPVGRHRFKLSQLPSLAPVKLVVKTNPSEALAYLSVCGMRLKPLTRDYVTVLYNPANSDLYITMNCEAEVKVSVAQVVRVGEFDLTVASMRQGDVAHQYIR